jgi:hypothetical protein
MAYIGKQPIVGNFVKLDTITTSATTTFNLTSGGVAYSPQSANNCIVSLNGVIQAPTSAYTISGSTIVFDSALTAADVIDFILVLGDVLNIGTPSDNTVSFSKVTSNLITGATSESTIAGDDQILIYDDSAGALRKMTRTNFVSGIGGTNTPAFLAYKNTSTQSVSYQTTTKVLLQNEAFDTDNAFDSSTNYRFTVPSGKAGKYLFTGGIEFSASVTNPAIMFSVNGSATVNGADTFFRLNGSNGAVTYSKIFSLNVSDYVEMNAFHETAGSANISYDSRTFFAGFKLIE